MPPRGEPRVSLGPKRLLDPLAGERERLAPVVGMRDVALAEHVLDPRVPLAGPGRVDPGQLERAGRVAKAREGVALDRLMKRSATGAPNG